MNERVVGRRPVLIIVVTLLMLMATPHMRGEDASVANAAGAGPAPSAHLPFRDDRPERPTKRTGPRERTEVTQLRTSDSRTYRTERGSLEAKLFTRPVNFRDPQGRWRAIDSELQWDGTAYRNGANSYAVELPRSLKDAVAVQEGTARVAFRLEGADGNATVQDNEARYGGAFDGVTVRYSAEPTGVKETMTLRDADARSSFSFAVDASNNLSTRQVGNAIEFVGERGEVAFRFLPPFMEDASGVASGAVTLRLERGATGDRITLEADRRWLEEPEREYPVVIDPIVDFGGANQDCYVTSGTSANTNFCGYGTLDVGWNGTQARRGLLKFDLAGFIPKDAQVLNAELGLFLGAKTTSTKVPVAAHALTRPWSGTYTGATWNRYDGTNAWTTPGGDFDLLAAASTSAGDVTGWTKWYPTKLVQAWVDGSQPNNGLLLKTPETSNQVLKFDSTYTKYKTPPYLSVEYEPRTGELARYSFQRSSVTPDIEVAVNPANGNTLVRQTAVKLEATDLDYGIEHFYNNLSPNTGTTGGGWTMNVGHDVGLILYPDGSVAYDGPSGYTVPFLRRADGTFEAAPGVGMRMVKNTDGTYTMTDVENSDSYSFNADGYMTRKADEDGGQIDYRYDATTGRLTSLSDNQGRTFTFRYDGFGFLSTMTDHNGAVHTYTHSSRGSLLAYIAPSGRRTDYSYDNSYNLVRVTVSTGEQHRIGYDANFRAVTVTKITDPATGSGPKTTYSYGAGSTTSTDAAARKTTYEYDLSLMVTNAFAGSTPPTLALSGPLWDRRGGTLTADVPYALTYNASESGGLAKGDVSLLKDVEQTDECAPACPQLQRTWTLDNFDMPEGEYVAGVTVTDSQGDTRTQRFRFMVAPDITPDPAEESASPADATAIDTAPCEQSYGAGSVYCQPPAEDDLAGTQPASTTSTSGDATFASMNPGDAFAPTTQFAATTPQSLGYGIADQDARTGETSITDPVARKAGHYLNDPRFAALKVPFVRMIIPYNLLEGCTMSTGQTGCRFPERVADFRDYYELTVDKRKQFMVSLEAGCSTDGLSYCPPQIRAGTQTNAQYPPRWQDYIVLARRLKRFFPKIAAISAWNEPNFKKRQPIAPTSTGAPMAALYTYVLERDVCSRPMVVGTVTTSRSCVTVAVEPLDSEPNYRNWTRRYVKKLKTRFDANSDPTVRFPTVFGFHPYQDTDRKRSFNNSRLLIFARAVSRYSKPKIWFTEIGISHKTHGAPGQSDRLRHLIDELATPSSPAYATRISRLYYYSYCNPRPGAQEDTGLINAPPDFTPAGCQNDPPGRAVERDAYNVFKSYSTLASTATIALLYAPVPNKPA
ncbi:MAG: DNRLRE domain-containing protein [Propionibacteriales bacterium]|nr:DNRLRE domain-containing protein [Propionibacteriales bacterium]